ADLAAFEEWRHLLPDKETHRLVAGHAVDFFFVEQRRITECRDGQAEDLVVKRLLAAEMIIDRRLIDRCAVGNFAHRAAVETVFGEHVRGMVEERLAGNFSYLHHYNFLAREVSPSPMDATDSTTRVSEVEIIPPRVGDEAHRILDWRQQLCFH